MVPPSALDPAADAVVFRSEPSVAAQPSTVHSHDTADRPASFGPAVTHDLARILALVELGQLQVMPTGHLGRTSLWRLARQCALAPTASHPPRAEADLPLPVFLFWLAERGGLVGLAAGETQARLGKAGLDWLAAPLAAQLAALREIWRHNPELTWHWLPAAARRPALETQWRAIVTRVAQAVAVIPPGLYPAVADLLADLEAQGAFVLRGVEHDLPRVRRSAGDDTRAWVRFLLADLLPALDLVQMAGAGADLCLTPTPAGAAWLAAAFPAGSADREPGPIPVARDPTLATMAAVDPAAAPVAIEVDADLFVTVPPDAPAAASFELAHFAELLSPLPSARYRVSRESIASALGRGYTVSDVAFLLGRLAGGSLPGPANVQLARWADEVPVIRCRPGYRLGMVLPVLAAVQTYEPVRGATERLYGEPAAFVAADRAPALFRYLRRQGYRLAPDGPSSAAGASVTKTTSGDELAGHAPIISPVLRYALPLVSLLTLVRTYAGLRRLVPGLADLDLAGVEATLMAVLSPPEQAAAAKLADSHQALLAQMLDASPDAASQRDSPVLAAVRSAVAVGRPLDLTYADTIGRVTQRRVHPLRLETRRGQTYLIGRCELRDDERWFRVDRIVEIR